MAIEGTDITPEERQLLTNIRRNPGYYLGHYAGLRELAQYLHGYETALQRYSIHNVRILPEGFTDYLCMMLTDGTESSLDWAECMLTHEPDNFHAFSMFWTFLDEYLTLNGHAPIELPRNRSGRAVPSPEGIETIREYQLDQLAESYMRTFNGAPWWDRWTKHSAMLRLSDLFHTPGFFGVAQFDGGDPVGALLGRSEQYFDRKAFQIIELWVEPAAQRQGVGQKLLAELRDLLPEHRFYLITMHGEATEGFYEKNGFVVQDGLCVMQLP